MNFRIVLFFLTTYPILGYANPCQDVIDCLRKGRLDQIEVEQSGLSDYHWLMITWQVQFLKEFKIATNTEDFFRNNEPEDISSGSVYFYINRGDFFYHKYLDKKIESLENYKKALADAQALNDPKLECEVLKKILSFHRMHYLYDNETYKSYLRRYKEIAYDDFELAYYHYYNLILNFKNYYLDKWDSTSYKWLLEYFETNESPYLKAITYTVFGSYYEELGDFKAVNSYIDLAEKEFSKVPYGFKNPRLNQLLVFGARIAAKERRITKLQSFLSQFDTTIQSKSNYQFKALYFFYDSLLDTLRGNYKSAYNKYYRYEQSLDTLRRFKYNDLLNELETKYQTTEKEKQLLVEQQKVRANRNWLVAAVLALLLGSGIAVLLQKNTTKKRQLAEQQTLLKQQRVDNLLKEQELVSIDAMIAGQEKERQRVANELHDDLGSLMATIQLHFDHAKISKKDPALKNAQKLLEQAYQKIRGMAHAKNSGVMSDQGLLPAIQKMAHAISETNTLEVTVEDFGMGERMENSLELMVFRMIQELVANAIKHAKATKVAIQLTQHEETLNIIVEDNGKGFDRASLNPKTIGMGLTNVEKRVEHLEGSFTIDSVLGKGTSILIDIPV